MSVKELQADIILSVLHSEDEVWLRYVRNLMKEANVDTSGVDSSTLSAQRIPFVDVMEGATNLDDNRTLDEIMEQQGKTPVQQGDLEEILPGIDWGMSVDEMLALLKD